MDTILSKIQSPQDLSKLTLPQLERLAVEMREALCHLVSERAAHFASNLGVVELCLALHTTFDFRHDRLIWDTGHQIYPHKIRVLVAVPNRMMLHVLHHRRAIQAWVILEIKLDDRMLSLLAVHQLPKRAVLYSQTHRFLTVTIQHARNLTIPPKFSYSTLAVTISRMYC